MTASLFINPHSERVGKKGSRIATYATEHDARVFDLALFETLPSQVEAALETSDLIVIEGGDGTVQSVMSEVMRQSGEDRALPDFAIASGGMTNQIAKIIGMKRVGRSGLKSIHQDPNALETRLLKLSCDGAPDQYGFLFSTGALPMVTDYAKNELHTRGIGGSAAVVGGLVKAVTAERDSVMRETDCTLRINGETLAGRHLGTVATTLPSITMGLDPFWGDEVGDLRLTYVQGGCSKLYRHIAEIWVGFKDKDRRPDGFHSWNAQDAEFDYSGPVMLDGEPIHVPSNQFRLSASRPIIIRR
ncbi:diacylglycerol kinase family protein [Algimonas porphyrae]|uniref:Diacylglycerol kinase n=1 Tax=Algimonas porphyrae TaxID=1128113 RepID=A0ABQ5UVW6_9PROT|nr:diacylglycerol kinase family protein [Algimonas porphyrae]GLQ19410.1 diacylglycerol kinase [Algimonas porphyrae]